MSSEEGFRVLSAKRGCLICQVASFLAAGGSPTPKLLD